MAKKTTAPMPPEKLTRRQAAAAHKKFAAEIAHHDSRYY